MNLTIREAERLLTGLEGFTLRVYEESSELFPAPSFYLEYRDGSWIDE